MWVCACTSCNILNAPLRRCCIQHRRTGVRRVGMRVCACMSACLCVYVRAYDMFVNVCIRASGWLKEPFAERRWQPRHYSIQTHVSSRVYAVVGFYECVLVCICVLVICL